MQLLGIFVNEGDQKVIKKLRTKTFYPFIDLKNFDYNNFYKQKYIKKRIEVLKKSYKAEEDLDRKFTNIFYSLNYNQDIENQPHPAITLNCIVGKNGSGKSSLLNLEYRIINNLSCKIQSYLKKYNQGYKPVWSTGFDAELYYELDEKIYCIQVKNNQNDNEDDFFIEETKPKQRDVVLQSENGEDVLFSGLNFEDDSADEEHLLERISEYFFYTVGTNYSIYSNSVVTDEWGGKEELWMRNIYHKNDGYFTPIVLVPYRNQWTTVDTKKELNLAKERLSTLSLLVYAQAEDADKDFIEGLVPDKICYRLKEFRRGNKLKKGDENEVGYKWEITKKIVKTVYGDDVSDVDEVREKYKEFNSEYSIDNLRDNIRICWKKVLESQFINCKKKISEIENLDETSAERIYNAITDNTVEYLTYKLIKMSLYYDKYRNFLMIYDDSDISDVFENDLLLEKSKIRKTLRAYKKFFAEQKDTDTFYERVKIIINGLLGINSNTGGKEDFTTTDFTNLKIKQCIVFLNNIELYINKYTIDKIFTKAEINAVEVSDYIDKKKRLGELNYDFIFMNLLPSYFNKEFYYVSKEQKEVINEKSIIAVKTDVQKSVSENGRTLASLSSGESQLLNALSYAVYHIKNATSSEIGYKNINLVFDEAELYYHPEYQRSFIKDLLGIIKRSNLSNVDSINISIVTHSPFILSDIPQNNLLCLENGERKNPFGKTLGANFYDLLQNQFFMESSTGSVVENLLNEILDDYKTFSETEKELEASEKEESEKKKSDMKSKKEKNIDEIKTELSDLKKEFAKKYKVKSTLENGKEFNFYDQFIEKLSDEYLQSTMRNLVGILIENDFFARRQQELRDKIQYINELKKQQEERNEKN